MDIQFDTFWMQKAGNARDEYEDAFASAYTNTETGSQSEFRCAVADGATETSFSGLWAKILVEAFAERRLHRLDAATLAALAAAWRREIDQRHSPLPWYAEEKLRAGAFSSLLGLILRNDGTWRALCVGDSCLFRIRPRSGLHAFPYHTPEQFNNHPALLSTNHDSNAGQHVRAAHGKWRDGDHFLLMTDALAHYFLSQPRSRAALVAGTLDQAQFEQLIESARRDRICRNDDVTFLKICPRSGGTQGGVA